MGDAGMLEWTLWFGIRVGDRKMNKDVEIDTDFVQREAEAQ